MLMEAGKSPDVQGDPAGDPGELMVQFDPKGRKKPMSQFKGSQAGGVPSFSWKVQPFCSIHAFN